MSTPINAQLTGTFTSDGTAVNISLPPGYTEIELTNLDDLGSAAANTNVMKAWGTSSMAAGSAIYANKTSGAATIAIPTTTTTGGFTFLADDAALANSASVALNGTEVNQANPAVANTATTTNLVDDTSVVRLFGTTGMLQIAGIDFTIGTVVASTSFELKYLDSSGFAAAATAGTYRIINANSRYLPRHRYITNITAATSAVVTLSVNHNFVAGQSVRFSVPTEWGMTEIDGLIGNITAVTTGATNTITVDIDSSAFTAFSFPTSAEAGAGVGAAIVVPVGETANATFANSLDDATDNVSITGVTIGTTIQTSGVEYQWVARRGVSI